MAKEDAGLLHRQIRPVIIISAFVLGFSIVAFSLREDGGEHSASNAFYGMLLVAVGFAAVTLMVGSFLIGMYLLVVDEAKKKEKQLSSMTEPLRAFFIVVVLCGNLSVFFSLWAIPAGAPHRAEYWIVVSLVTAGVCIACGRIYYLGKAASIIGNTAGTSLFPTMPGGAELT